MTNTKTTPDPFEDLNALLDKPVTDWKGEQPGDRVTGTVVEISEVEGIHSAFPVVVLDTGSELVRVACSRSVLGREIRSRDIQSGDALAIQYRGPKETDVGKAYHHYRVVHRPENRVEPPRHRSVHDDEPPYDDGDMY